MNIVNVATLKQKLSYYLRLAKEGQEVLVTSHRHRIARIVSASTPASRITDPARPVKDLQTLKAVKPRRAVSAVDALLQDRRRR